MTSKVTSATVSEVKFASETDNINPLTLSDIKNGFAGCSGAGIPMTSANFNAVLNWITENIGLQEDIVVETIKGKKYLITKAKDGSTAKIEIVEFIKGLRDSGVLTTDDLPSFGNGFKLNVDKNQYNGHVDERTFEFDETGLLKLKLSPSEDNQLQIREDGIYLGKTPEQNAFFVDYISGNDDNNGTKDAPLKSIITALSRIKHGTIGTTIYLKEGQTHTIAHNGYITLSASVEFRPYGDILDKLEARWNSPNTGWSVIAAKEYYQHLPVINVIPSWQISSANGTNIYTPTWLCIAQQNEVIFSGLKFNVSYGSKDAHINWGWNSMFMGKGSFMFMDCTVLNKNNDGKWTLVDDHDGLITTQYRRIILESKDPKDAITGISKKMTVEIEGEDTEKSHPSGLTWMATTKNADVKASVRGANNITPTSSNYVTNIQLLA